MKKEKKKIETNQLKIRMLHLQQNLRQKYQPENLYQTLSNCLTICNLKFKFRKRNSMEKLQSASSKYPSTLTSKYVRTENDMYVISICLSISNMYTKEKMIASSRNLLLGRRRLSNRNMVSAYQS